MATTYYRTDRLIAVRNRSETAVEVRTYTAAVSAAEARAVSRPFALAAAFPTEDAEILGLETVIDVPGVTTPRAPEILRNGSWHPIPD